MKIKTVLKGEPHTKTNQTKVRWSRKLRRCELYIPEKVIAYEDELKQKASEDYPEVVFSWGPVVVEINYYLSSFRRKDLPNLPKTTCDALEGSFYHDDSQIIEIKMKKFYDKKNPRVEITAYRPEGKWEEDLINDEWPIPKKYSTVTE